MIARSNDSRVLVVPEHIWNYYEKKGFISTCSIMRFSICYLFSLEGLNEHLTMILGKHLLNCRALMAQALGKQVVVHQFSSNLWNYYEKKGLFLLVHLLGSTCFLLKN